MGQRAYFTNYMIRSGFHVIGERLFRRNEGHDLNVTQICGVQFYSLFITFDLILYDSTDLNRKFLMFDSKLFIG